MKIAYLHKPELCDYGYPHIIDKRDMLSSWMNDCDIVYVFEEFNDA